MSIDAQELLTQKELALRWGVTTRTILNERKRWRMRAAHWIGIMPLFSLTEVERVEALRHRTRSAAAA